MISSEFKAVFNILYFIKQWWADSAIGRFVIKLQHSLSAWQSSTNHPPADEEEQQQIIPRMLHNKSALVDIHCT